MADAQHDAEFQKEGAVQDGTETSGEANSPATPELQSDGWPVPGTESLGKRDGVSAWLQYGLMRVGIKLLDLAPGPVRSGMIAGLAGLARRFDREHTRVAREFLQTAFGPEIGAKELEQRVSQAWRALIRTGFESSVLHRRLGGEGRARHFTVEGYEPVRELLEQGGGVILVTSHVGNWEAFCAMLEPLGFRTPYVIGKPPKNRPLSAFLQRRRQEHGLRLLPRQGAMRDVPRVLAAGGTVGMLLDQRPRKRGLVADFFGRPALCDRSAGVLLRRARVPVVFSACYRTETEWRFRLVFFEILWPKDLVGLDSTEIAEKINGCLERIIMEAPEQYLWLHDRYRGVPATAVEAVPGRDSDSDSNTETTAPTVPSA